jgi:hypothetical protein
MDNAVRVHWSLPPPVNHPTLRNTRISRDKSAPSLEDPGPPWWPPSSEAKNPVRVGTRGTAASSLKPCADTVFRICASELARSSASASVNGVDGVNTNKYICI